MVQLKFGVGYIKIGKIQYHDTTHALTVDLIFCVQFGYIPLWTSDKLTAVYFSVTYEHIYFEIFSMLRRQIKEILNKHSYLLPTQYVNTLGNQSFICVDTLNFGTTMFPFLS